MRVSPSAAPGPERGSSAPIDSRPSSRAGVLRVTGASGGIVTTVPGEVVVLLLEPPLEQATSVKATRSAMGAAR